jgi:type IX secretion system PorP/SprF family membrane protein
LVFLDQIDPEFGIISPGEVVTPTSELVPESLSRMVFDVSVGMLAYTSKYYFGFSLKHVNAPDLGFFNEPQNPLQRGLPLRMLAHAGTDIILMQPHGRNAKPEMFFSPSVMYVRQGRFQQLMAGSMFTFKQAFGGIWYRHAFTNGDAVIFTMGGRFEQYRVAYSYDFTVSRLYNMSGGSHEISFGVLFADKRNKYDTSDCFQLYR